MTPTQTPNPTDTDDTDHVTPDDVRSHYQRLIESLADDTDTDTEGTPGVDAIAALLTPRTRAEIWAELLAAQDPLTVADVVERTGRDQSTVNDHLTTLADWGYLSQGKKGNARVFAARDDHPVVQLLSMLSTVARHGVTPDLLADQFIGEPGADYEPGDHPKDNR